MSKFSLKTVETTHLCSECNTPTDDDDDDDVILLSEMMSIAQH